ncbi:hypothetical protein [Agrococcus citreus]
MMADTIVVDFLARAAREFRRGGWVFTGFHWPVLAGRVAHALDGAPFTQVFEAGVSTHGPGRQVATSTTDYPAYADAFGYLGDSASILLANARRFDRVVLDASNVDIRGRVNSSFIGADRAHPTVRLPGGGGAPDIAGQARELVWLCGAPDLRRFQAEVEHVTAAPGPRTLVRLHTRWGVVRLGDAPVVEEVAPVAGADAFLAHAEALGASTASVAERERVTDGERAAAVAVLTEAAARGYQVASRAMQMETKVEHA